jgi:hypothetical protein
LGTVTWGSRRRAVATPGYGRNPLQGLCGRGVGVRNGVGLVSGRGDEPPGLSVEQLQATTRQPCGAIRWFSSHDRPEAYPTDVATNLRVCRSRGRHEVGFVEVCRPIRRRRECRRPSGGDASSGLVLSSRDFWHRLWGAGVVGSVTGGRRCARPPASLWDPAGVGCAAGRRGSRRLAAQGASRSPSPARRAG